MMARFAILALLFLAAAWIAPAAVCDERPNVVVIITDDQGMGDFGVTGNPSIATPHLDQLARHSAQCANFYVSPVCSPTRACLMTGRYNYRTRCIDTYIGRSMMDPDEITIAELLSGAGYSTGMFGKWHLGDCFPMRPQDQGFDEVLMHRGGGLAQPSDPLENQRRYTDAILFHNGRQVETSGYCTDVYFDAALEFISAAQESQKPFFAYIATNAPHGPLHDVPSELLARYREDDESLKTILAEPADEKALDRLARIAAMITNIDDNVGRLMNRLDELQLTKNTLVVVLIDNGPDSQRYNAGLRGKKSDVYDGGIRSPLWMHWPARLPAGQIRHEIAAHIDLLPTLAAACQVDLPTDRAIDGRNLLPLFDDSPADWPERSVVIQSHRGDAPQRYHHFMLRRGDWKLVHSSGFGKTRFDGDPQFELYDLGADPGETRNVADRHPQTVGELRAAYDQWFADVSTTRENNFDPPRIVIGDPREPLTTLTRQDWRAASWSDADTGQWLVRNEKPGLFAFDVIVPRPEPGAVVALKVGDVTRLQPLEADQSTATFDDVGIEAGDWSIVATVHENENTRGAHQVKIRGKED